MLAGFDFFVTPWLVRLFHGRCRSKTSSCTAEVAHGFRCVFKPMVCRSGLGQEKALLCSSEAADLAAIAIVFQQEPMAAGFGPTDGFVVLMPFSSLSSAEVLGELTSLY